MKRLPAEWEEQSGVIVAFPHSNSDWKPYLKEAEGFYVKLIAEISKRELCIVLCEDAKKLTRKLPKCDSIKLVQIPTNDTWCRDFCGIAVEKNQTNELLDFGFNGWGLKFASNHDNIVTKRLFAKKIFKNCKRKQMDMVLEGGSIESDGAGSVMTTTACLLEKNRNPHLSKKQIEKKLKKQLGAEQILWLDSGFLVGDDTDSHIDVLARFANEKTILHLASKNGEDEHFESLQKMREELKTFKNIKGEKYDLVELPMTEPLYFEGERVPTSYANFLIINDAVIVPIYNDKHDGEALEVFKTVFKDREIVPLDASVLVRQHGSIHCVTMNYPIDFL